MPLLEALYLGQVTIILLALFAGAWLAIQRERRFAGGVLVFVLLLRRPTKWIGWPVGIAVTALSPYWLYVVGYAGDPPVSGLVLSFGFYTLIVLWGVNFYLLQRKAGMEKEVILATGIG